jgi:hypothetical protein
MEHGPPAAMRVLAVWVIPTEFAVAAKLPADPSPVQVTLTGPLTLSPRLGSTLPIPSIGLSVKDCPVREESPLLCKVMVILPFCPCASALGEKDLLTLSGEFTVIYALASDCARIPISLSNWETASMELVCLPVADAPSVCLAAMTTVMVQL